MIVLFPMSPYCWSNLSKKALPTTPGYKTCAAKYLHHSPTLLTKFNSTNFKNLKYSTCFIAVVMRQPLPTSLSAGYFIVTDAQNFPRWAARGFVLRRTFYQVRWKSPLGWCESARYNPRRTLLSQTCEWNLKYLTSRFGAAICRDRQRQKNNFAVSHNVYVCDVVGLRWVNCPRHQTLIER